MARPIWKGSISFGLVNIPVSLYAAIAPRADIHFHLLDSRNMARVKYERVNAETGEEVPWQDVVKAYEYEDGNYVVVKDEELKKAAPESTQTIEIENFIDADALDSIFFEKPYYLVPDKKAEKGYVLLREILKKTNTVGIAKIIIRSKEYLTAVMPYKDAILIDLLRYGQELRRPDELNLPVKKLKDYKINEKELQIAEQLVEAMRAKWQPEKYHDEFQEKIMQWIEEKVKKGKIVSIEKPEETAAPSKVVDFMELLRQSVKEKAKKGKIKV